jgi:hypothetical protein
MNDLFLKGSQGKTLRVHKGCGRVEDKRFFLRPLTKVLPPRNVSSVEVERPDVWVGFVQFSIVGGIARDNGDSLRVVQRLRCGTSLSVCELLRSGDTEFIPIGLSKVERATQDHLSECAGESVQDRVVDARALFAVFIGLDIGITLLSAGCRRDKTWPLPRARRRFVLGSGWLEAS